MNKQSHFELNLTLRASSVFAARPHLAVLEGVLPVVGSTPSMKFYPLISYSHFEPKPTLCASSVFAARPHFADAVAAVAVAASDSDTGQGQSHCRIASDNKCERPNGAKLCTAGWLR
jgi:hypothetical protein